MTEIETPSYLRRVTVPRSPHPLPAHFTWTGQPGIAARLHQTGNECWAIAALQMTQDRARIAGIRNYELEAMTPSQLERESIRALASQYDKLHGLPAGTVASRRHGGILAMALDYLELAGHAKPESAVVLRPGDAENLKQSVYAEGPVAVTYDGDGAGEIHSACVVGWDDTAGDWLLRNSWGPTTERLSQTTKLVAFAITPNGDRKTTTTPFSGGRRRYETLLEWYNSQSGWMQAGVGVAISAAILLLGFGIGLLIWYLGEQARAHRRNGALTRRIDKKYAIKKIPDPSTTL